MLGVAAIAQSLGSSSIVVAPRGGIATARNTGTAMLGRVGVLATLGYVATDIATSVTLSKKRLRTR